MLPQDLKYKILREQTPRETAQKLQVISVNLHKCLAFIALCNSPYHRRNVIVTLLLPQKDESARPNWYTESTERK